MELTNIIKSYGDKKVLENINLTVYDKEFLVILGNSGSGKSTLLKIIAGIEKENAGIITVNEKEIQDIPLQKRNIGYLFQEPLLFPHMTVKQNVIYSLVMSKTPKEEIEQKFAQYMDYLQIDELAERMPHQISGGQKQRVSIARAIINSPKILLMDEPFSSLDYNLRRNLGQTLLKIKEKLDLTIVFVTHDIDESMLLADRIAFLHEGNLLEINTPQNLFYNPKHEQTAKFMGDYNIIKGEHTLKGFETKYGIIDNKNIPHDAKKIYVRPNKIRISQNSNGRFSIESIKSYGTANRIKIHNEPVIIDVFLLNSLKENDKVEIEIEY